MAQRKDNPGVLIPPPLMYAALFFLSILLEKLIPFGRTFFLSQPARIVGIALIGLALCFNIPALLQFLRTRNSVITIKPANSLQTSGIYSLTRNPMYLSLALLYTGLGFLFGNWWTMVLLPFLIALITYFVIRPEEKYLERAFGKPYLDYKHKVRRWI